MIAYHIWGKLPSRTFVQPSAFFGKLRNRWFESSTGDEKGSQILAKTGILVQDGTDIQEVPLIVRRVDDIEALCHDKDKPKVNSLSSHHEYPHVPTKNNTPVGRVHDERSTSPVRKIAEKKRSKRRIDIETDEGTAILYCSDAEYRKYFGAKDVLNDLTSSESSKRTYLVLENKITEEINCRVALDGLKKIIDLESSYKYTHKSQKSGGQANMIANRDDVLKQLVKIITRSRDSEMILQGLAALKRDKFSPSKNACRDWMCEEVLIRVTDGQFTLPQLISAIKILSSYRHSKYRESIDALWVGIETRDQDINADVLVPLFKVLHFFNHSKKMVRTMLERKLADHWLRLTGSQMAEILNCFHGDVFSSRCLISASKWAAVSMNISQDKDLVNFLRSLDAKDYIDDNVERALEEYVKMKGAHIRDPALVGTVMNYCENLLIRNPHILSGCGEYFMKYGMDIPASLLGSILTPFGRLNILPPNTGRFWHIFDQVISQRFSELKLNDALEILLSCVYLEKYPIKFTNRIFMLYFREKVHAPRDSLLIRRAKDKLKLFDATMSLECENYHGPRLPPDKPGTSLFLDERIRRITTLIHQPLAQLVGGKQKISTTVHLNRLPLINFYVLDILIHPLSPSAIMLNLNLKQKRNVNTAVLIHLPEYYCRNTNKLIGPQGMRKRHIRKLGFRVMTLNYAMLEKLLNQTDQLSHYLSKSLDEAEDAL